MPIYKKSTELITDNNKNNLDKWEKYQSNVSGFKNNSINYVWKEKRNNQ